MSAPLKTGGIKNTLILNILHIINCEVFKVTVNQIGLTEEGEFRVFSHAAQRGPSVLPECRTVNDELSHRDLSNLKHNTQA